MDNLFLEEFIDNDQENVKEIKIHKTNVFQINNDNVIDHVDDYDYDINTQSIIHKQDNISEDTNESKIYDISKLFTKEITKERLLISYEDMNNDSFVNFNGSYECEFKLNKKYKNVIGFRLDKAIYENIDTTLNGSQTNIYLDVIINNIPREASINNLKGYNIIKRLPYEYSYSNSNGVSYNSFYMKDNYFYPINLDKISLSLKYNHKEILTPITRAIGGATQANPVVITTTTNHGIPNRSKINITGVVDMVDLNTNNPYYIKSTADNTFELYSDESLTSGINSSGFVAWGSGGTVAFNPGTDLIDLKSINTKNFDSTNIVSGLKFSFEFELTLLNR